MSVAITKNTTDLEALLVKAQNLPDAGSGAVDPVLKSLTVTPSTTKQTFNETGIDGYYPVVVNAMPTATQATPSITVSKTGLITASATQTAGYVTAGTKSGTKQLTVQAAQTITPGTSNQTIASGRYLTGTQTIKGDSNLVAANIAEGVNIFGVLGTFAGSGGGMPDGFTELTTGTITFTNAGAAYDPTIEHGAGFTPNFFLLIAEGTNVHTDFSGRTIAHIVVKQTLGSYGAYYSDVVVDSTGRISPKGNVISTSDVGSKITAQTISTTAWFKEGKVYRWYAGVLDMIS